MKIILNPTPAAQTTRTPLNVKARVSGVSLPGMRHLRLACLLPWMVMTAAWASPVLRAPVATQSIDFTYRGAIQDDSVRLGDKCYVTFDFLRKVGWDPNFTGMDCTIQDDGRTFKVPVYSISGRQLICLNEVGKELGAKAYYGKDSDTFYFKAMVTGVSVTPTGVLMETSLAVRPVVTQMESPARMTIDLKGAEYDSSIEQTLPPGWRLAYSGVDTVRLAIDHPALAYVRAPKVPIGRDIRVALPEQVITGAAGNHGLTPGGSAENSVTIYGGTPSGTGALLPDTGMLEQPSTTMTTTVVTPPPVRHVTTTPSRGGGGAYRSPFGPDPTQERDPVAPVILGQPITLGDAIIKSDSDDGLNIQVMTGSLPNGSVSARYTSPESLLITFKGAVWGNQRDIGQTHLARSISRTTDGPNAALRISTEVPLVFDLANSYGSATIRLTHPKAGGLSHKLIVIDPGHGGEDHGGSYGALYEKDITLRVGLAVSKALHKEGASVIMTRDDDSYPSLTQRCNISNSSRADAFISIHVNDVSSNAPSASMTFYHGGNNAGLLLAECLQTEIARVTRPESWGAKDDYTRFRGSGMFVLHHTDGPGVLTEIGFINNPTDRADMLSEDYPDRVATAIVRALQRFFGGRN